MHCHVTMSLSKPGQSRGFLVEISQDGGRGIKGSRMIAGHGFNQLVKGGAETLGKANLV